MNAKSRIFVFGSNLSGIHGGGAALHAHREHGAIYGRGVGPQGSSYAIPTKDWRIDAYPLERIAVHVADFLDYARARPDLEFDITPIGCGLAGFKRSQIEPLFAGMPSNCHFTASWDEHHD